MHMRIKQSRKQGAAFPVDDDGFRSGEIHSADLGDGTVFNEHTAVLLDLFPVEQPHIADNERPGWLLAEDACQCAEK